VFCQNFGISQHAAGRNLNAMQLGELMVNLQTAGCHNINLVTPEHVVPQILEALVIAVGRGLRLPLIYNTSAYDSPESLQFMEGVVDIYMPDFKLWHAEHCAKYLLARDYADAARAAITAMHAQVGELTLDEDGLAVRGLMVRHLVMPGLLSDTREIMHWLAGLSRDTYVNVMDQYRPCWKAGSEPLLAEINRSLKQREFEQAIEYAHAAGLWRLDGGWLR
jgi:putative pyruvate formate lyase activating enzyme